MAEKRMKKIPAKRNSVFNFTESYTSLILGAIVVLVIGILFVILAKGNRTIQTSSVNEGPNKDEQASQDNTDTSSAYTIKPGDDLWSISENIYQDGYKWIEIAKLNKLENPELIHAGNKLNVPTITKEKTVSKITQQLSQTDKSITQNNSITGNTYSVVKGDNLWDIAVRAYGDGFRWSELAKVNNLDNPSLIHPGNVFKIPR